MQTLSLCLKHSCIVGFFHIVDKDKDEKHGLLKGTYLQFQSSFSCSELTLDLAVSRFALVVTLQFAHRPDIISLVFHL